MNDKGCVEWSGEIYAPSVGALLCGPRTFSSPASFGCTLLDGGGLLRPKPTVSGWLFQITISSHGTHIQGCGPEFCTPLRLS